MKFEAILGRLLLATTSMVLAFLLVDYISIWLLPTRSPIEQRFPVEVFRNPQPYTMFGGTALAEFDYETENGVLKSETLNSLGYRGPEPLLPKPQAEYRIFVLGGSTIFLGDPPIPALLEEEFRNNGIEHVKVYNAGVISSVSGMELTRIVFEISNLEPDLIVMYNGGNDIFGPYRNDPRPGYPFNYLIYENNPLLESDVSSYPALALFAYGSNIARYFFPSYFLNQFSTFEQVREETEWGSEQWRDNIAQIYVDNLVKANTVSKAFDAEFIAFAQPMLYLKKTPAPEEADLAGNGQRRDHVMAVRAKIRSKIEQADLNTTVKIIDLSTIYDDTADWVFTDSIHTRQQAKTVIAEQLYHYITHYFDPEIASGAVGSQ